MSVEKSFFSTKFSSHRAGRLFLNLSSQAVAGRPTAPIVVVSVTDIPANVFTPAQRAASTSISRFGHRVGIFIEKRALENSLANLERIFPLT